MSMLLVSGIILIFLLTSFLNTQGIEEMRGALTFIFFSVILIVISKMMIGNTIRRDAMSLNLQHNEHKEMKSDFK